MLAAEGLYFLCDGAGRGRAVVEHQALGGGGTDAVGLDRQVVVIATDKRHRQTPRASPAGCGKRLRSLLPYSYLPLVRGRRFRKEAIFYAGCHRPTLIAANPFFPHPARNPVSLPHAGAAVRTPPPAYTAAVLCGTR